MNPGIRRTLRITIAGLLAAAGLASPALAAPGSELQALRNRIESLQKELDSKEDARADASDELKTSERAISNIKSRLRELGAQQQQADIILNRLEQQKDGLQKRIDEAQGLLGRLLYQKYRSGRQDQFKILLNQENPNQVARQLHYYSYLAAARNEMLNELRDHLGKLEQLTLATESRKEELDRIRAEQDRQKQQLVEQQQARKQLISRLGQQIGRQRSELDQLLRNEKRLTRLIERLSRQQPQKRRKSDPGGQATARTPPDSSPPPGGKPVQAQKGKLPLPVRGELVGRFGAPRQDSGAPWRGLFIRTAAGQEVHSIAPGRVVFADWLRGFGNLIIIDHGEGYMSLYGNNESLFRQVGENIRGGDVIASTGNSGGNPETGLYFELRYQSRPFDPLNWCRTG